MVKRMRKLKSIRSKEIDASYQEKPHCRSLETSTRCNNMTISMLPAYMHNRLWLAISLELWFNLCEGGSSFIKTAYRMSFPFPLPPPPSRQSATYYWKKPEGVSSGSSCCVSRFFHGVLRFSPSLVFPVLFTVKCNKTTSVQCSINSVRYARERRVTSLCGR